MSNLITTVLEELVTCLCAQVEADGLPPLCMCGLMPGDAIAADYAGDCADACGMATVRLSQSYPSTVIGQPNLIPGNCASGIGIDVELAILRCIEVGGEDGQPVPPETLAEAAELQHNDMLAMWRAVNCCRTSKDYIISAYTPLGPEGGLVGGAMLVSILVL
jgi:hypothetical protein